MRASPYSVSFSGETGVVSKLPSSQCWLYQCAHGFTGKFCPSTLAPPQGHPGRALRGMRSACISSPLQKQSLLWSWALCPSDSAKQLSILAVAVTTLLTPFFSSYNTLSSPGYPSGPLQDSLIVCGVQNWTQYPDVTSQVPNKGK